MKVIIMGNGQIKAKSGKMWVLKRRKESVSILKSMMGFSSSPLTIFVKYFDSSQLLKFRIMHLTFINPTGILNAKEFFSQLTLNKLSSTHFKLIKHRKEVILTETNFNLKQEPWFKLVPLDQIKDTPDRVLFKIQIQINITSHQGRQY